MSEFTKKWRVTHPEPLTYNERIINSACDIIERQDKQIVELNSQLDNARDYLWRRKANYVKDLEAENKKLKENKAK
jgi:hypothetical protein